MAPQKLAIAMAISAAGLAAVLAQNSPEDYVRLHNAARGAAGARPVAWDVEVAREAGRRTERGCGLRGQDGAGYDDGPRYHRYGENLFRGPPEKAWNAGDALDAWTAPAAREYVQVVWPDSTKIGCARAVCDDGRGVFISCNYEPAGKMVKYKVKVRKVHTDLNVSDPMTKPLPRAKHEQHRIAIGVRKAI